MSSSNANRDDYTCYNVYLMGQGQSLLRVVDEPYGWYWIGVIDLLEQTGRLYDKDSVDNIYEVIGDGVKLFFSQMRTTP